MSHLILWYRAAVLLFFCAFTSLSLHAQDVQNPGNYMTYIADKERFVTKTYLTYLSAVSHGKSARKVEKLREKVLNTIYETRIDVSGVPPFKGDKTLRDAAVNFLKTCYSVFNEDYSKIVNMEEIAEQSYDAMEAYMLAQEKANEKLDEAAKLKTDVATQFASRFNVTIVDTKDELSLKAEQSGKVIEYYNKIYLVFFKSHKQDMYLTDALNASNLNAAEQSRSALLKYATEGLKEIEAIKAFQSDLTLVTACKKVLLFYKDMCENKVSVMTDYLLADENYKKAKKTFDQKPAAKRTQEDVDSFNKAVNDMNNAGKTYNKINAQINKDRSSLLDLWNKTVSTFMDNHIPYTK